MIIVIIILALVLFSRCTYVSLSLLQQNHYFAGRYIYSLKKHYLTDATAFINYFNIIFSVIYDVTMTWYSGILVIASLTASFISVRPLIVKPNITKRAIRLLIMQMMLVLIPILIFEKHILIISILITLEPSLILIANFIMFPIERIIANFYIKKAKRKLEIINPKVIAITGSYGKTSVKNYIYHLLKNNSLTIKSPKSYNTPMGITKTIREYLLSTTETFIVEMGASNVGDIKELVDLVKPSIAILTEIGPQHLATFKTIDNIIKTKFELLENEHIKMAIVNIDNNYINEYINKNKLSKKIEIITVGLVKPAFYQAHNILLNIGKMRFDIYKENVYYATIETCLLGRHNVYNLLLAFACADAVNIPLNEILTSVKKLKSVEHRLSVSYMGNIELIDDSFNANIEGFKNALDVLKMSNKLKVLLTPGIVDAGNDEKKLNSIIAKKAAEICDRVYLVSNPSAEYIKKALLEVNYTNFFMFPSFQEAYFTLTEAYQSTEITLLIENDLPDNYLRR